MPTYTFPEREPELTLPNHSELICRLLENRGVDAAAALDFLNPNYETALHDPRLLHDIDVAVKRIKKAFANNEKIAIFSDYDCDGIPGGVVLHDCFKALKYENFINYIPHRHYEGFGLSTEAVEKLHQEDVSLIITIDCGTSDVEAVARANELDVDIIITDHHEPGEVLPKAVAIVNPKLGDYPFTELCGAAVAFKLAQVLLEEIENTLAPGQEKWWLDMVGLATIADMVPLIGENRALAHYGLMVLQKSRRPGLQALLKKNRVNQRFLTEEDIGFTIGPRINAASRMDSPEAAFKLLTTNDHETAGEMADHLEKLNKERKTTVATMTRELHKRVKGLPEIPNVLVLGSPEWRPSLVGLTASKLAEEHNRPVFVWGRDGNGKYKGSCRSGGGISVVTLMQEAAEVFEEHGGHHFSGGFTVKEDQIYDLSKALNTALDRLGETAAIETSTIVDEVLSLETVNYAFVKELALLAPYGVGNEKPIFAFKQIQPRKVEQFGKTKEHLKLLYETENGSLEAIAFFAREESFTVAPKTEVPHTLIANVEQSFFMGRQQLRLRIVDIV